MSKRYGIQPSQNGNLRASNVTFTYGVITIKQDNKIEFNIAIGDKEFESFPDALGFCRTQDVNSALIGIKHIAIKAETTQDGTFFAFQLDGVNFHR